MSREWPIDFDSLDIGGRVSEEKIAQFCGHAPGEDAYKLKGQLAMVELIRNRRPDLDPYVRCAGNAIIIMEHGEASRHRASQGGQALRRFVDSHRRNMMIDTGQLTNEELEAHDRTLYRHGRYVSALSDARRELRLEVARRSRPTLKV